jgi:hypothetical protein
MGAGRGCRTPQAKVNDHEDEEEEEPGRSEEDEQDQTGPRITPISIV